MAAKKKKRTPTTSVAPAQSRSSHAPTKVRTARSKTMHTPASLIMEIPLKEYASRRATVLKNLHGAAALVFAGVGEEPLLGMWQPNQHFAYLTGITDEPGAVLLLDPKAQDPRRQSMLFLKHHDPEIELWHGYREQIGESLKARYGLESVMRLGAMPRVLTQVARLTKRFAVLHDPAMPGAPVSADLAMYRTLAERVVGVDIKDQTGLLPGLRSTKSRAEIALLERAVQITSSGFDAAIATIAPGRDEADVATALVRTFDDAGGQGLAYNPIVGAGLNSTVLHYMNNKGPIAKDDLVLIDAGARFAGYNADITRTYPASGKFTNRQRKIYDIVLEAMEASIAKAKPGVPMWRIDKAARDVIAKAGFADAFMHGIGHQLGMETHDAQPDTPLAPGMIITIEPGIYLPDEKIGIRIEDDILITAKGTRNLSKMIAKDPREIERMMR